MVDEKYGRRDRRGDWKPFKLWEYPPVIVWPPRPKAFLKWMFGLPGFIFPYNLIFALVAVGYWFILPPIETFQTFELGWIAYIWAINIVIVTVFFGFFHVVLYSRRSQGKEFKYNAKWLATDNKLFFGNSQLRDNLFYTYVSGVTVWTAYLAVSLWLYANHLVPWAEWAENPVWIVAMFFIVSIWRDVHFYMIHRLIHWPPLYKLAHHVHHRNVNIGPFSGLAMHPVEHLFYFSCVLLNWVVASHPVNAIHNLVHAGMSPAPGHCGFDQMILANDADDPKLLDLVGWDHYLHHRYYEVNYADGVFPLDKWFGTFHDGSDEAHARMLARFKARKDKLPANQPERAS